MSEFEKQFPKPKEPFNCYTLNKRHFANQREWKANKKGWKAALEWLKHRIDVIDYVGYQEIGKIIEKELKEL